MDANGPAPFWFGFEIRVPATSVAIRERSIRSVLGDANGGAGDLEVLERGPDRFASRMRLGEISQLRVVEWEGADRAIGAIEHSEGGRPRLSARYRLVLSPEEQQVRVAASYELTTPFRGLAWTFRLSRRRSLARRLATAWLPSDDPRVWRSIELAPRSAAGARSWRR